MAPLLNLLRAGEHSAEAAFGRIARRLPPAAAARMNDALHFIQQDEQRHTHLLSEASDACGIAFHRPLAAARRFLTCLENCEPAVHLGRIAALDAGVCQVLSHVLAARKASLLPANLHAVLASVRCDEGHHVRIARTLALDLGCDPARLQDLNLETRHAFDRVLACYESSFAGLGIDTDALRRKIRRDAD